MSGPGTGLSFQPAKACMAIKSDRRGRCVALTGTVGRRTACSVYQDRPKTCAEFMPGSDECLEIRRKILGKE